MFAVELEDGTRLEAYKHRDNRRYLHISSRGEAFVFEPRELYADKKDRYRRMPLVLALSGVLGIPTWPEHERTRAESAKWAAERQRRSEEADDSDGVHLD